jgi:hypothetical protein
MQNTQGTEHSMTYDQVNAALPEKYQLLHRMLDRDIARPGNGGRWATTDIRAGLLEDLLTEYSALLQMARYTVEPDSPITSLGELRALVRRLETHPEDLRENKSNESPA